MRRSGQSREELSTNLPPKLSIIASEILAGRSVGDDGTGNIGMSWKHLFAKKDLEMLLAEMAGEHRLHRVLGPVALTSLGVGCIIGAGIFVMTGRAAAHDAGPAVIVSFAVAALGCALAALCYAEFAAMAPVAGSAYTYAYTTLGEIFAWIIGWDLILEYAMGCATVASAWSGYLNEFLLAISHNRLKDPLVPARPTRLPRSSGMAALAQPAVGVHHGVGDRRCWCLGIRESVRTNAILVIIKLVVVVFVVAVGWGYVQPANWTEVPYSDRLLPEEQELPKLVQKHLGGTSAARNLDKLTKHDWRRAIASSGSRGKPSGCKRPAGSRPRSRAR